MKFGLTLIVTLDDNTDVLFPKRYAQKLGGQTNLLNKNLVDEKISFVIEDPQVEGKYIKLKFVQE